jgi:hypothetical protein
MQCISAFQRRFAYAHLVERVTQERRCYYYYEDYENNKQTWIQYYTHNWTEEQ